MKLFWNWVPEITTLKYNQIDVEIGLNLGCVEEKVWGMQLLFRI